MKLYNTLSRKTEEFKPLADNKVKLYTCGLTVYSQPHIGNWVPYIYWDVLVRVLRAQDYNVEHVQNITDVGHLTSDEDSGEDKMLKSALKEGTTAWDVANKYIKIADHEAFELLGLLRPTHLPRATEYIPQQIAFVQQLEKKGYIYVIKDGVYFDTSQLEHYGELARLDIKGLRFGARVKDTGKKNPTDFAVWKFSDPNEKRDMEWDSPWGKGFPGWHLECSVMARELLGDQIDIHTGGIDHIPIHHTNEIAQSESVTGKRFANFWVHANHLKVNGTKIAKSLGNGYTLEDVVGKGYDIQAFKLMVLSKHYRTEGNFTWEILEAAQNRLKKWRKLIDLRWQEAIALDDDVDVDKYIKEILRSLNNDLDTPRVMSLIDQVMDRFDTLHFSRAKIEKLAKSIHNLLGIDLLSGSQDISAAQKKLLAERQAARAAQDFNKSDRLRDELEEQGLQVSDPLQGTVWIRAVNR